MTKRDVRPSRPAAPAILLLATLAGALAGGCADLRRDPIVGDGSIPRGPDAGGGGMMASAGCGNGTVEQGETCDPPGSCPSACPAIGCTRQKLEGSAATCTARCVEDGKQTACAAGDRCCPAGCTTATDEDCNCTCGNGSVEGACGERCDPLASCPAACAPEGCRLRRLVNPGTCQAECIDDGPQTACAGGDGCCPAGCNAGNDSDCKAACGNGAVEAGETCDPASRCPTECPPLGCTRRKLEGATASCTARCVDDGQQTACQSGDGCCPPGCTTANDSDCQCTCGNGVREGACGETCDPVGSCPASCPPMGCTKRRLVNPDTCQARCVDDGVQTACAGGDGCCPGGCNATNDSDCSPRCGNGTVESGEQCDPTSSCPTTCPWQGCARRKIEGTAAMCTARCLGDGTQTACARGDGCCPSACNANNDNDCQPRCGNGVVEGNEVCDGNCPSACPNRGCQRQKLQGSADQCNARCVDDTVISACASGDGCCASGCTSINDGDCMCRCGNGVTEPACNETCDGNNCAVPCQNMGCQTRTLAGSAASCNVRCVNGAVISQCKSGDGCCPSACNSTNDGECSPVCGNLALEAGETCDPPMACKSQSDSCVEDRNTIKTRAGSVEQCTFRCDVSARPCRAASDGFCPATCTPCGASCGSNQDIDCARPPPDPTPQPPGCPNGRRCCEPDPDGTGCLICIPPGASCP